MNADAGMSALRPGQAMPSSIISSQSTHRRPTFVGRLVTAVLQGVQALTSRKEARRLQVAETISLGEKRFVSILKVDGEQFLVGGSAVNLVLLAKLDGMGRGESDVTDCSDFGDFMSRAGEEFRHGPTQPRARHLEDHQG